MERVLLRTGFSSQMSKIMKRTSIAMFMRLLRIVVSFSFNVLLARMLGAEGSGVYFLAYTITRISSVIARIGLDNTLVRFVAAHSSKNEWDRVTGVVRNGVLITVTLSLIATAIVILLAPYLAILFSEPQLTPALQIMAISILPWSLCIIYSQIMQGVNQIVDAIFLETVGIMLVNIPLLLLLTASFGTDGAALSFTISTVIILILGFRLWGKYVKKHSGNAKPDFDFKYLIENSLPLFWLDFTLLAVGMVDTLILGFFSDTDSVGIYNTVKRVSVLASAILTAINVVIAPQFAAMHANGDTENMGKLARDSARLVTMLSIPVVIAFVIFPTFVLSIFGEEFTQGSTALIILTIGQFVNAFTGSVGFLLIMTGHQKIMRNISIGTSILFLILLFILIPLYGIEGATWATTINNVVRNLLAMYFVYRLLSIITIPLPDRLIKKWELGANSPK